MARQYRGDAPAVSKVLRITKPISYVAGAIHIHINNKTVSWFEWDAQAIVDAWNSAIFLECVNITASIEEASVGAYGSVQEAILLSADEAGIDFFVTTTIGDLARTNEVQLLTFDPEPDGGTFTLTFDGQTTGAITFVEGDPSTTAANILAGLEALSNIAPGDVVLTIQNAYNYLVTFGSTYAETDIPLITTNYANLTGGDVVVTVSTLQQGVLPVDEVQTLSLPTNPTGGTFTLTYAGQTTGNIAYNASAATVQAALEALSNIAVGDVVCTGGLLPATPVVLTFGTALGDQDVALLIGDGALLTGGSANLSAVTVNRNGSAGSNFRSRYYFVLSPTATVRWKAVLQDGTIYRSAFFSNTASLATIKAALVGLTIAYPVGQNLTVTEPYVLTSDDVDIVSTAIPTTGSLGGCVVEWKGNLANRNGQYTIALETTGNIVSTQVIEQYAAPAWEEQKFQVLDNTLSGQYTITVYDSAGAPHTIGPFNYTELNVAVFEAALNTALSGKYVFVTLSDDIGVSTIFFSYNNYGYQIVNITAMTLNEGDVQIIETVKGTVGTRDIQQISANGSIAVRAGTFTITYDGQTTSALNYNDSAATILAALEALSNVSVGDLQVTGGPISEGAIQLSWKPLLGNVSEVTVTSSLVNSVLTVTESITGGILIDVEEIVRNKGPMCFDDSRNYDPQGLITDSEEFNFEFGQNDCLYGIKQKDTFTVYDLADNTLRLDTHRPLFQDGQRLLLLSSTTAPAGLTSGSKYYVINMDGFGIFQLSATLGGAAIDITDIGTGTHSIGLYLTKIVKPARFSRQIGLPRNNDGYEEYLPRYLELYTDEIVLGEGDGNDSPLQRYDLRGQPVANGITIYDSGTGSEPNVAAIAMLTNDNTIDVKAYGGELCFAPFLDETSIVRDIECHGVDLSSIGGVECRNLTLDSDSSIKGKFTPSGVIKIGL